MTLTLLRPTYVTLVLCIGEARIMRSRTISTDWFREVSLAENSWELQHNAKLTPQKNPLYRSYNKAACFCNVVFPLCFLRRRRHYYHRCSRVSLTWPFLFVFESVFYLDPFTGKFASNCFWKSHFHYLRSLSKRKELRAIMADIWTVSDVVRDKVCRKERPGEVSWMKQER